MCDRTASSPVDEVMYKRGWRGGEGGRVEGGVGEAAQSRGFWVEPETLFCPAPAPTPTLL